ncbi:type VI secretion system membrane subunit TssM [Xenorhabdus sp. 12]|uniref:Type VI secretion system membrane subunit TssM n=1 Tax=Xenorhabdus santafensis TaxID=2582833 RepID=A0ABU4S403_9GAMM|nr:type VI secretion system membrane subunit TssM [Xenorhabdus sp. 12]MDX7985947.1 type VI secretion system membrane subunit TssM [Xenorhabdus sp. 12]
MLKTIISIIANRLLWGFIGITTLSFVIWYIGPLLAINGTIPFQSSIVRIVTIALIFLLWIFIQLIPYLYQAWSNKKAANKSAKGNDENHDENKKFQYSSLSGSFSNAARLLKNAYFYGLNSKYKPSWRHIFSHQYLYQLPWYAVIGAPQSGKTSILANSGLHFPLADHFEKSALDNMKGRDNCNWWFTNEAVFLDTTGRYTTQDTQHEQNVSEWKYFIDLLKKYRARQPLNGVIVTISVEDLLNPSKESRDKQAYVLRKRLSELHEQLKTQFPIYIIITKTDLLKGFTAYFSHLDETQREQIWGFNLPWNQVEQNISEIFDQQYSLLQKRLEAELPDILLHQSSPRQCAESYLFPQEFAALRPLIAQYIGITFAQSGFETPYSPRGLFFTSSTQEGFPFDRVMEKFNHDLQLATDNGSASLARDNNKNFLHQPPLQQDYFLKNLLGNIFQEAGLASHNRWWIYRNRLLNGLSYTVLVVILGFIISLLFISYKNNKNYLMEVQAKIPLILHQETELKDSTDDMDIYALLPILDNLADLGKSKYFSLNKPPLTYRMGLYSGDKIDDASWSLYTKALHAWLLPRVAKLITSQMHQDYNLDQDNNPVSGNDDNREDSYNTLKAYQMLYQPKHYDGKFLRRWVMHYLQTRYLQAQYLQQQDLETPYLETPYLELEATNKTVQNDISQGNIPQEALEKIDWHLSQLLDNQPVTSPYLRDEQLVKTKQLMLSSIPLAQIIYTHLKYNALANQTTPSINLVTLAGPQAELVFSRISGISINLGIPAIFTPAGYQANMGKELNALIDTLYNQDNWVLGIYSRKQPPKEIALLVRQFYINDYISQWDRFLSDIHLNNIGSLEQRANMARLLAANNSPLRTLLINISKNLTLDEGSIGNKANKFSEIVNNKSATQAKDQTSPLAKLVTSQQQPNNNQLTPEQMLKEHFAQIIALAASSDNQNKTIPFDSTLKQINQLYEYLNSVQTAANLGMPAPPDKVIMQLQTTAEHLPTPFSGIISSLAMGASSDTQLSDINNINKKLNAEVNSFCNQAIANRYPLTKGARNDIKPDDLTKMFAPGTGIMDVFFQKNLMEKTDTTQPDWRLISGVDGKTLPGSLDMLRPFKQAQIIRDTFFSRGAASPSFRVIARTIDMDNDILSMILDVDGQRLQYSHGPQVSQLLNWPGPSGTNQVRIQLNLDDGTTASLITSGPWALNRFLDRAKYSKPKKNFSDDMSLRATFNINGHSASLEFIPNSIYSPFQLPNFTCPNFIGL